MVPEILGTERSAKNLLVNRSRCAVQIVGRVDLPDDSAARMAELGTLIPRLKPVNGLTVVGFTYQPNPTDTMTTVGQVELSDPKKPTAPTLLLRTRASMLSEHAVEEELRTKQVLIGPQARLRERDARDVLRTSRAAIAGVRTFKPARTSVEVSSRESRPRKGKGDTHVIYHATPAKIAFHWDEDATRPTTMAQAEQVKLALPDMSITVADLLTMRQFINGWAKSLHEQREEEKYAPWV